MAMNPLYTIELEEIDDIFFTEEAKQRYQVKDFASLGWTMRKLSAIEAKKRELTSAIDAEIERLKMFLEKETIELTYSENFFKSLISEYAARKRDEDPDYKSDKTPYGKIAYRKVPDKWLYDEDLLVAYLEQNEYNNLIRTKKEPVKTDIKKLFSPKNGKVYDNNGQKVDGISIEYQADVLDIKTEV